MPSCGGNRIEIIKNATGVIWAYYFIWSLVIDSGNVIWSSAYAHMLRPNYVKRCCVCYLRACCDQFGLYSTESPFYFVQ